MRKETVICKIYSLMSVRNQDPQPHLNAKKVKDSVINAKNITVKHSSVRGNRSALNILI